MQIAENTSKQHLPLDLDEVALPDPLPPLIITAFTRPDLLAPVLEAIDQQVLQPREIIAYIDGARNEADEILIQQCVDILEAFNRPERSIQIRRYAENLGCDQNVIRSFTEVLSTHEYLIYIEDDDLPNPWCYDRLCRLLSAYKHHPKVFSVTAYSSLGIAEDLIETDFFTSHRVFSWGFGIWADRWLEMNLAGKSGQYNPFGQFYKIPAKTETKMTLINQFWLEKNHKTDWVITMTLFALSQGKVHIVPKHSLVKNIGFGHEQSETYRGKEQSWVNCRYSAQAKLNSLPRTLQPYDAVEKLLTGVELAQYFDRKKIWLSPSAYFYLLRHHLGIHSSFSLTYIFLKRLVVLLKRWKGGLKI